jgi:hypothetical protein
MRLFRPWSRRLLTALLACQLAAGLPVQAQAMPSGAANHAAAVAAPAADSHCASHASVGTTEGLAVPAAHAAHHATPSDKGCCGHGDHAQPDCSSHCGCVAAGALAAAAPMGATLRLQAAGIATADMIELRVDRRPLELLRPPI